MNDNDVSDLLDFAKGVARRAARGKLHDDDAESEAGLAVTKVLAMPDVKNVRAAVTVVTCNAIWRTISRQARYEHPPAGWWHARVEGESPRGILQDWSEQRLAIIDLYVVGHSIGEIAAALSFPWRDVANTIRDVRRELKGGSA